MTAFFEVSSCQMPVFLPTSLENTSRFGPRTLRAADINCLNCHVSTRPTCHISMPLRKAFSVLSRNNPLALHCQKVKSKNNLCRWLHFDCASLNDTLRLTVWTCHLVGGIKFSRRKASVQTRRCTFSGAATLHSAIA